MATAVAAWLVLCQLASVAAQMAFQVQTVPMRLCGPTSCFQTRLVMSAFGRVPFGSEIRLQSLRFWLPALDPQYPESCGTGPDSVCQYSCAESAFQTAEGPLTLNSTAGIVVLRSPGAPSSDAVTMADTPPTLPSKAQCSFIAKAARAATTGAGAVIIVNQVSSGRIAMTSGQSEVGIQQGLDVPPTFLFQQSFWNQTYDYLVQTLANSPNAAFNATIDLTDLFPKGRQVNITVYQERLWDCDENIRRADCLRKTGFLEPRSQFSQTLRAWLRRGVASLTFRTKNIGQCRDADAAASSAVCAAAELNCLAGQQYCSVDPDGFAGAEGGSGQSVLIEAIRTRCVNNAAKANNAPQLVLTYYDAWSTGCLSNNNFTDACALATFERDVLPQWSEDALAAAETTRAAILEDVAACFAANTTPLQNGTVPFLEADLQQGAAVEPEPGVLINGQPVFAAFTPENALAAACSAFAQAARPQECAQLGLDVCSPGQEGAVACAQGLPAGLGRTQCVVTAGGFECGCPPGTMQQPLAESGQNASDPDAYRCAATGRCVQGACGSDSICVPSSAGDIRCVPKREMCNEANNYGGCYVSDELGPNNERLQACVSLIAELQARAQETMPPVADIRGAPAFRCDCAQLPCHSGDGATCARLCPLERCLHAERPELSTCAIGGEVDDGDTLSRVLLGALAGLVLLAICCASAWGLRCQRRNAQRFDGLEKALHAPRPPPERAPSSELRRPRPVAVTLRPPDAPAARDAGTTVSAAPSTTGRGMLGSPADATLYINRAFRPARSQEVEELQRSGGRQVSGALELESQSSIPVMQPGVAYQFPASTDKGWGGKDAAEAQRRPPLSSPPPLGAAPGRGLSEAVSLGLRPVSTQATATYSFPLAVASGSSGPGGRGHGGLDVGPASGAARNVVRVEDSSSGSTISELLSTGGPESSHGAAEAVGGALALSTTHTDPAAGAPAAEDTIVGLQPARGVGSEEDSPFVREHSMVALVVPPADVSAMEDEASAFTQRLQT